MPRRTPKPSEQILEEASSWFIGFQEDEFTDADREEFTAWLRRSPEHVQAYLSISAFWEDTRARDKPTQAQIDALVARVRTETNVVPLVPDTALLSAAGGEKGEKVPGTGGFGDIGTAPVEQRAITFPASSVRRYATLAATILIGVLAGGGWYLYDQRGVYSTEIAEQRAIVLEDGSRVELNAGSRLKVHFSEHERTVDLLDGQALFSVAKNPERPFIVKTPDTQVRAVGTQFDVYRKRSGTIVTVVEGRVAVVAPKVPPVEAPASSMGQNSTAVELSTPEHNTHTSLDVKLGEVLVSAGEQILVAQDTHDVELDGRAVSGTVVPANITAATAWTENKLVFESTPLRDVVDQFNRYNRHQLIIKDPSLNDYHVTGEFPSTDPSRLLQFLQQRFGVTLTESGGQIEITRRDNAA